MRSLLLLSTLLALSSCTDNEKAKSFGGKMYVDLPAGETLKFATWKEANLWYATEPRPAGVAAKQTTMRENSVYGLMQGVVVFREH